MIWSAVKNSNTAMLTAVNNNTPLTNATLTGATVSGMPMYPAS
jgi:hypothetical protein